MSDDVTIGGSEAPVIVGASPWMTPLELYQRKRGLVQSDDEPSPAMKRGTALEGLVADYYAEATGRVLDRPPNDGEVVCNTIPWATGHIDRLVPTDPRGPGVVEIKCPGVSVFGKITRQGVPDYYQVQLQHYLAVTGLAWGSLAVFSAERWQLLHFDVPRDDTLIEVLLNHEAEFRERILAGDPPSDTTAILDLPHEAGPVVQVESPVWASAARDWIMACEMKAEAEALEEHAKDRIVRVLAEAEADAGEGAGLRVYYRGQAGRMTLDKAAMKAAGIDVGKYERRGADFITFKAYPLRRQADE